MIRAFKNTMWEFYLAMSSALNSTINDESLMNQTCGNTSSCTPEVAAAPMNWPLLGLVMVIFCTSLGNLLVCLAVCWDRRLQNMTNYFLMSLAIADFLVSIIVMPFGMVVEIYGYFPLGAEFCAFWVTMDVLMCTASIWHMCTMSMDRYFTLKYPMQYGRNKTKTMVAVKIVFVWAVSITISSPICIYALVDQQYVYNEQTCVITIQQFVIYGSIFAFYVPLCIMILTYMLTIRILWQNQHMMRTIERSNFRMRPRSNNNKHHNVMTYLSPPSSDSKHDSHTDISSLARTPNMEKQTILSDCSDSELKLLELKNVIDNSYVTNMCTKIPNGTITNHSNDLPKTQNNNSETTESIEANVSERIEPKADSISETENNTNSSVTLNIPMTTVHIQSPSSDDDDEFSSLLQSRDKLSRSFSQSSSSSSRFRLRTNTDISNKSYLSIHSSLKIPKHPEKYNSLQSSVSCSNFINKSDGSSDLFESLGLHGGNGLNRDYKSLEWCHHFYEIQEEMDQCLRDSKREQKHDIFSRQQKHQTSSQKKGLNTHNSVETHDSGIASCSTQHHLSHDQQVSVEISESGDSLDDVDTSSENVSELLNIKLHPKSVYMYKLDKLEVNNGAVNKNPKPKSRRSILNHVAAARRRNYMRVRDHSSDSESTKQRNYIRDHNENDKIMRRKAGSIKKFIHKCKQKNGFRNLVSSKTTTNEKKASKVLGIIFGVFVILWTPFFIANIISVTCSSCAKYITPGLMSSFVWMGYIASLANPIIYTMFNTAFRRAFIKILSCHMCTRGRTSFHLAGHASHMASVLTDRRQTMTVLANGVHHDRIANDTSPNNSNGR